jgi:hypothetical protein
VKPHCAVPPCRAHFAALACLMVLAFEACGGGGGTDPGNGSSSSSGSGSSSSGSSNSGAVIPVPGNGAYFGAWVNPDKSSSSSSSSSGGFEAQTETLESQIGRKLALHMHYYDWGTATQATFPDSTMLDDQQQGRTPVVSWRCGDTVDNIASGADDALLINQAQQIKQFGSPIFLRWYWEFNLPAGTNDQSCLTSSGAQGFINAWQHIWTVFRNQGVSNVVWLWCPAGAPTEQDPAPYYPGSQYVDWIGVDRYDKEGYGFTQDFTPFYTEFATSSYNKPIMIAETGACPDAQVTYLSTAASDLQSSFTDIKAFLYFDSPGNFSGCIWNLADPAGINAFAQMGANAFFSPQP